MRHTKKYYAALSATALIAFTGLLAFYQLKPGLLRNAQNSSVKSPNPGTHAERTVISIASPKEFSKVLQDFLRQRKINFVSGADTEAADLSISASQISTSDMALTLSSVGTPVSPLSGSRIVTTTTLPAYLHLKPGTLTAGQARELRKTLAAARPDTSPTWTLNALGDIIPGRTVYKIASQLKDQTAPYAKTADFTKNADLTLANLELSLSDNIPHPTLGMTFSAPTSAIDGLKYAGIDAVNLANNHSHNDGSGPFLDTLAALDQRQIPYFGGGHNMTEAHTPRIMTVKGIRIALLGYSSIIGSVEAGNATSGMATLSMAPWGPFEEAPVVQMEADIKAAKGQADLVFVYYHWGAEYTHTANADQRTVAHRAIDAGADLILGTHPHWVQGVEWYHGKLITYSLGNFVFDQDWSTETKQGVILSCMFQGTSLVEAKLTPYQIENFYQPRFVQGSTITKILNDVYANSWWVGNP
jgi:poly-gamma-glutamate capsule biosynthesis protein CapA/YwtB (metallophosphatase superfamily)